MKKKNSSEFKSNIHFLKDFIIGGLKDINPWNNIKIMHTNIRGDIMAGITVAIIALPLALAFGVGSGLGAIAGLWGAIAGGIIGGFFGGSSVGVSGPTGPKMVQLAAIMLTFQLATGEPDLVAAFSIIFLSGLILVLISLLRVSRLIYFTPYSVVAGFMCGIGVIVMLLEFDSFLGVEAPHSVVEAIMKIPHAIMDANPDALIVSLPTLGILFAWPHLLKLWSGLKIVPAPLVALLLGTGLAQGLGLDIEYISDVPTGLPHIYLPDLSRVSEFIYPALSLAGLAVFDSLLTCIVADNMIKERHSSDRETFGQGIANMVAGLIGGLTTATATMRTVANVQSGGKTPLASMIHGLVLLALVLGLAPLAEMIPMACLAAILFKVGIDILDWRIMPVLHRLPLSDMLVFWTVLIVTVVEDLLVAMGVGIALAFLRFVQEMSKVYHHRISYLEKRAFKIEALNDFNPANEKHIKLLHPEGPLFFGSVDPLIETYHKAEEHDILIIDLSDVTMADLSGAYALEDLVKEAEENDVYVIMTGAKPKVLDVLKRVKVIEHIGENHYHDFAKDAISEARKLGLMKKFPKHAQDEMPSNIKK